MKKRLKTPIFRTLIWAAMSFCSLTANAQTTKTPILNKVTGIYDGIIVDWKGIVDASDTVDFEIEISATSGFGSPKTYVWKSSITATKNNLDTITVSMGLPAPPKTHYVRIKVISTKRNDSLYSNVEFGTSKKIPAQPKIKILSHYSGINTLYFNYSTDAGSPTEEGVVTIFSRYGGGDWEKDPRIRKYIGVANVQDSITDLYSNEKYEIWIFIENYVGDGDTSFFDSTSAEPQQPVVTPILVNKSWNMIVYKYAVTTFNQSTTITESWTGGTTGNKTVASGFKSYKMEYFLDTLKNLSPLTKYTITVKAVSGLGTGIWTFSETTNDMPVTPSVKINYAYAISGGMYFNWDWATVQNQKILNTYVKVYKDSLRKMPVEIRMLTEQLDQLAGNQTDTVRSAKITTGNYWVSLTCETDSGFLVSNLEKVTVNFNLDAKPVSKVPIGPIQCKLYDMSGKLVSESYTVDPKVNLFTQDLPNGVLIAITKGYPAFRVYNGGVR